MAKHYHWGSVAVGIICIIAAVVVAVHAVVLGVAGEIVLAVVDAVIATLLGLLGWACLATASHATKAEIVVRMEGKAYKTDTKQQNKLRQPILLAMSVL